MKRSFVIPVLIVLSLCGNAQDTLQSAKDTLRSNPEKKYFELSLGHSLLFISNSKLEEIQKDESVIVPTNAILFFAEFRPLKKCRIPVFVNIPTEARQYLVKGQLVYERASPTFGFGAEFKLFSLPIGKKSSVEMEVGPLASFLLNQNNVIRFAPIGATRIRFMKNRDFVIYIGSSYSVGVDAFGILFGTGYIF